MAEKSEEAVWDPRVRSIDKLYLGRGWAFPVRWRFPDSYSDRPEPSKKEKRAVPPEEAPSPSAQTVEGVEDIRQAIWIILETMLGERVMQPEFGSHIHRYLFAPINAETKHNLGEDARKALLLWERRIRDIEVEVIESQEQRDRLDVKISFAVDIHRPRQSLIYPFYVASPGVRR